jgi:phosphoribosylformylglycinamidine cyclo-ligase
MLRTFNCGVGFVAVAARADAGAVIDAFTAAGETAFLLGEIEARSEDAPQVVFSGSLGGR